MPDGAGTDVAGTDVAILRAQKQPGRLRSQEKLAEAEGLEPPTLTGDCLPNSVLIQPGCFQRTSVSLDSNQHIAA